VGDLVKDDDFPDATIMTITAKKMFKENQ